MSSTTRGLAWVLLGGLLFVLFIVSVRFVGSDLPAVQAAFIRYGFSVVLVLPVILRSGPAVLRTRRLGRHGLRGLVHGCGVLLWFYAITRLPVAEATALSYTSPIFVALGAFLLLGERASLVRIVSTLIGLAGILVILRPGVIPIGAGAIAILCSAPLFAASKLLVKSLLVEDDSATTVIYLSLFATLTMLVPAIYVWQPPELAELALLMLAAAFATLSHYTLARGLKLVDVTVAQPVEFLMLVWSTLFGIVLFGESPSIWVWVGAAVIVFSVWLASAGEGRRVSSRRQN